MSDDPEVSLAPETDELIRKWQDQLDRAAKSANLADDPIALLVEALATGPVVYKRVATDTILTLNESAKRIEKNATAAALKAAEEAHRISAEERRELTKEAAGDAIQHMAEYARAFQVRTAILAGGGAVIILAAGILIGHFL